MPGAIGPSQDTGLCLIETGRRAAGGRTLPADFKPGKVVYAILMENGRQLTPDTLFPFSQATLAHVARILGTYGIDVEVAAIPAA